MIQIGGSLEFKALIENERVKSEVDTSTSSYGIKTSWKPVLLQTTARIAGLPLPPSSNLMKVSER